MHHMAGEARALEANSDEAFVTLLRRHRIALGMTQTALAAKMGIAPSTVSYWESGRWLPHPRFIPKLARVLGLDALELTKVLDPGGVVLDKS
jgi:transcriptional regulator with XRE-family HTH domain